MTKPSLTAIIPTFNEELHLQRCLDSIRDVCETIIVVDSYSSDATETIALNNNVKFVQNSWVNYSQQFNWVLEKIDITTSWILRIDADEYLTIPLKEEIKNKLNNLKDDITGVFVKRLMYFMGAPIKRGGMYPIWHIKLWRNNFGHCEQRWMDERIILKSGRTVRFDQGDLVDHNLNNLSWWTIKHNTYSIRETVDVIDSIYNFSNSHSLKPKLFGNQEERKRWLKLRYLSFPLFVRPFIYWFIRYFVRGGILEGKRGAIWNFLHAFWYRFLVDVKIYEAYKATGKDRDKLIEYFQKEYGYDITKS